MRQVRSYHAVHPSGTAIMPTSPHWGQLLMAGSGSIRVRLDVAAWTLDRERAAWVPADTRVRVQTRGRSRVYSLYLPAELDLLPQSPRMVVATPLLRAIVVAMTTNIPVSPAEPRTAHLLAVLADLLVDGPHEEPFVAEHLPLPTDPRALAVAEAILADPGTPLTDVLRGCGASRRTVERVFRHETGLGPATWQRRARLQELAALRADGHSVTEAAGLLGYSTPSALAAMVTSQRRQRGMVAAAPPVEAASETMRS